MNWDDIPGMRGPRPGGTSTPAGEAHLDTFVIFQHPQSCPFCRKIILAEDFTPPTAAYTCPHVRKRELDELFLKLDKGEVELRIPAQTTCLQNGAVQVTIGWVVPIAAPQRNVPRAPNRL